MPISRIEDRREDPGHEWTGEHWGGGGRPLLLLTESGDDRSTWWPAAARLAGEHAVAVLDQPPAGLIADRADALAEYTALMGTRAPVVAACGRAAVVAALFAARYVAHAVVAIEQPLDRAPYDDPDAARALKAFASRPVRCRLLAVFGAEPRPGYRDWLRDLAPAAVCAVYDTPGRLPHLGDPERFASDVHAIAL